MTTTLNRSRAHHPYPDGWSRLLRGLGKAQADDEPLWIDTVLEHNGLEDALWCLRAVEGHGERALVWIDGEFTHAVRKSPRFAGNDEQVSE
ncbi:MAG: hypothetical protein ACK58T_04695, partial [Phycisphaerae bacterium]